MNASNLTIHQPVATFNTAQTIGLAFRNARLAAGHSQAKAAAVARVRREAIGRLELGQQCGIESIVHMLSAYGLSIAVVRTAEIARQERAA